ncbi:hypothetical protein ACTHPH_23940 [Paenibacillus pasadenensis]|uniref:Uncharacterized protein n=1 Tax=Paenibacillus albicereus TaxID=2726185 RepID=A0A6H2H090_9BACL|nr:MULTISPECIES: hypothetical protein [Paenibacillus]QJC53075.1 hypothetical protein HGI30_16835 [Paenibacillus albicereus]
MAIRKADLYDFINAKALKRKAELKKEVLDALKVAFTPVIHQLYKDLDPIERSASSLHTALLAVQERHPRYAKAWNFSQLVGDIGRHLTAMRRDIIQENAIWARTNLLDLGTNGLHDGLEEAYSIVESSIAPVIKEYKALVKVSDEVLAIVEGSRSGDKAYRQLQELGVDLTGFEPVNPNLPAVIKLSADVCILNGNCS